VAIICEKALRVSQDMVLSPHSKVTEFASTTS
jgi:hypothetical protein